MENLTLPRPITILCREFQDKDGNYKKKIVVIAPINIKKIESGLQIGWACSYGESCYNKICRYALARKIREEGYS